MDSIARIAFLLDFYGDLLPQNQRNAVQMVYEEDLSLSEIAAQSGISRQAVHLSVKRGVTSLNRFEEKIHALERMLAWRDGVRKALSCDNTAESLNRLLSDMEERYGL